MKTILLSLVVIPLIAFIANYVWIVSKDPYFMKEFGIDQISKLSEGKSILITGGNAGLGYSSAKIISQAGTAKVLILGCRNMRKCVEAKSSLMKERNGSRPKLVALYLDLASIESVKNFATQVQDVLEETDPDYHNTRSAPKLDILMNNAGIMGQPYKIMEETGAEIHMHVNHLAHFALTSLLSKNLEDGGRVVNVSSLVAAGSGFGLNFNDMNLKSKGKEWFLRNLKSFHSMFISYGASKRANLLFTHGINQRLSSKGIDAVVTHPGYSRTSLPFKWHYVPPSIRNLSASSRFGSMSSDFGALTQVRAAFDVENVVADSYVGPLYMTIGKPVIIGSSTNSLHHFHGKIRGEKEVNSLWEYSEKSLGMQFEE